MKNKDAIDDLVQETLNKVREGRISREEGREELRATLRRFKYDSKTVNYALTEYDIYS